MQNKSIITLAMEVLLREFFPNGVTPKTLVNQYDNHAYFLDAVQLRADHITNKENVIKFFSDEDFYVLDKVLAEWDSEDKTAEGLNGGVWNLTNLIKFGLPNVGLEYAHTPTYHKWIFFDGKHYDASCPEGVDNWYELPVWKSYFTNS